MKCPEPMLLEKREAPTGIQCMFLHFNTYVIKYLYKCEVNNIITFILMYVSSLKHWPTVLVKDSKVVLKITLTGFYDK